ncbi:MAG: hypothetical protein CME62_11380 [Halobacteriovoraceae bacterium]|nr:hypothetical protein [Halobacteriovoraceae bacterium]|tara:strand:+ start:26224 stop:27858 length:1635 start_codon:yes stop_codon:yes gene_type:complete
MQKFLIRGLLFIFILQTLGYAQDGQRCQQVLDVIYRDITLENLELSYRRALTKFLYSVHFAQDKTRHKFGYNSDLARVFNALKEIDQKFSEKNIIGKNRMVSITNFWGGTPELSERTLYNAMKEWKEFQSRNTSLFSDMNQSYKLDSWDMMTMDIIDEYSQYQFSGVELRNNVSQLAAVINSSRTSLLEGIKFSAESIEDLINQTQNNLKQANNQVALDRLNEYAHICNSHQMSLYISSEQAICPIVDENQNHFGQLNLQLNSLQSLIDQTGLLQSSNPVSPSGTVQSAPLVSINQVDYTPTSNTEATYCTRDMSMVTHLVIHHTATDLSTSPTAINNSHIQNNTGGDPWYMISYNYLVSEYHNGGHPNQPAIIQGRPDNMKGAHAGGYTPTLSPSERAYYAAQSFECGNPTLGMEPGQIESQIASNTYGDVSRRGGISGNIISLGIAIVGNFSTTPGVSLGNGESIPQAGNHVPDPVNPNSISQTAKLACQLQRQYPTITKIVPHNYFKSTVCPGYIKRYLNRIAQEANELGCSFNVIHSAGN